MSDKVSIRKKLIASLKAGCLVTAILGVARVLSVDAATLASDWKLYLVVFLLVAIGVYSSISIGNRLDQKTRDKTLVRLLHRKRPDR